MKNAVADYTESAYNKLNYRSEVPFHELLDAFAYSSRDRIFASVDYRLAAVWELDMISYEIVSDEDMASISNGLASVIDQFPDGTTGQVLRTTSRDIDDYAAAFNASESRAAFVPEIKQSIVELQRRGASVGFLKTVPEQAVIDAMQREFNELKELGLTEDDEFDASKWTNDHSIVGRGGRFALRHRFFFVFCMDQGFDQNGVLKNLTERVKALADRDNGAARYEKAFSAHRAKFLDHVDRIERSMTGMNFSYQRLTGQGLVDLVFVLMNPERARRQSPPRYEGKAPLREIMGQPDPEAVVSEGRLSKYMTMSTMGTSDLGWQAEGHHYRVTSVKHMTEEPKPHLLMRALSESEGEGWCCFNFSIADQRAIRMVVRMRKGLKSTSDEATPKKGFFSGDEIKSAKVTEDLRVLDNATNPEETFRRKVLDASIHMVCREPSEDRANRRARGLETLLWESGYMETLRGDAVLHSTLPMNFRKGAMRMLGRTNRMMSSNMTDLVPFYRAFPGVDDGKLLVNNSDGSPINIDPFTRQTPAPHQLIVGGTGSGKSFLVNALTMQMRSQYEPKTIIIDKGRSFEQLCESMDGQYVYLVASEDEGHKPICMNPLHINEAANATTARQPTGDEIEYMQEVIVAMCKSGTADEDGRTETVIKEDKNLVQRVLITMFRERRLHQEFIVSDFTEKMRHEGERGESIVRRMSEFTRNGIYGPMFDGPLDVDWDNPMVVIETERFADRQAMDVVMLTILAQIDQYMKYRLPRGQRKMLVIDEAWRVLANHAQEVGQIYREARKYNCSISLISQTFNDFKKIVGKEGDADDGISANTSHFYFLGSNPADRRGATELLELDDEINNLWRTTLSVVPFYTEFLYIARTRASENYAGAVRLYSNPVTLWLSSTDPDDDSLRRERIDKHIAAGCEYADARRQAVIELSEEYPYGSRFDYKIAS